MRVLLAQLIAESGPLPMDRYMALCLAHPKLGYYMTRDPFGATGDFTTAPEISQVFGELLGVWCVAAWEAVGAPSPFVLVELGPGRGTLMADILRATRRMEDFQNALSVHLVEMSPVLRHLQQEKLGSEVTWHESVATLPDQPLIFVANEFFDALPVRQLVRHDGRWFERCVAVDSGALVLTDLPSPAWSMTHDGVYEVSPAAQAIAKELAIRIAALGGAGLVIDYGHLQSAAGDSLQAVKNHKACSPLDFPGTSDLTAHVDFEALAAAFAAGGVDILPTQTQGRFLRAMGLEARTQRLSGKLSGAERQAFVQGANRLVNATDMGDLFKVLAVAQPLRSSLFPFET